MSNGDRVRAITLILEGGHLIQLGGAVDRALLAQHLRKPRTTSELLEIVGSAEQHLTVRSGALIGMIEGEGVREATATTASFPVRAFVRVREFLSAADHDSIVAHVLAREAEFELSKVSSGRDDYRKSVLLDRDDLVQSLFRPKIQAAAVDIAQSLGLTLANVPELDSIECQVTAHFDGGFYHAHTDTGSSDTQGRIFSYVYYFQSRPHAFFGGELKLYEPHVENGFDVSGAKYSLISPEDNSIVFFPSHIMHEVLPTYVRSGAFSDSRFTVNGWVRTMTLP
jgi:Rps23 Pro-64 3,4-dihydroxylase Tpa1-like proline 4-hydroxylase